MQFPDKCGDILSKCTKHSLYTIFLTLPISTGFRGGFSHLNEPALSPALFSAGPNAILAFIAMKRDPCAKKCPE